MRAVVPIPTGWVGQRAFAGIVGSISTEFRLLQSGSLVDREKIIFRRACPTRPAVCRVRHLHLATMLHSFSVLSVLVCIRATSFLILENSFTCAVCGTPSSPDGPWFAFSFFSHPWFRCCSTAATSSVAPILACVGSAAPHWTSNLHTLSEGGAYLRRCLCAPFQPCDGRMRSFESLCPWHVTIGRFPLVHLGYVASING